LPLHYNLILRHPTICLHPWN